MLSRSALQKCYVYLQGLFQDFASEGANAKFQNSKGGKYKAKEGQPHIKRMDKPMPRGGANGSQGGQKHPLPPPPPPEINPDLRSTFMRTRLADTTQHHTHSLPMYARMREAFLCIHNSSSTDLCRLLVKGDRE